MKYISSTNLAVWAQDRDGQEYLPLLIRRLIKASPLTILDMLFPAGNNVVLSGYDGQLETLGRTVYIPNGKSIWEMGAGKDYKGKAESDYLKRTQSLGEDDRSQTTFVFVTLYTWPTKNTWVEEKRSMNQWKDVKVIDGRILEEWIEDFPAVGSWLANILELAYRETQPLDQFWTEWSNNGRHSISPNLVISARKEEVRQYQDFLARPASWLTIQASSEIEAIAFAAAAIMTTSTELKERLFAKAIIIDEEKTFRSVSESKNPMILIAKFEAGTLVDHAVKNGHHVIIPIGKDITVKSSSAIELSRIKRVDFEKGLEEMGFKREEAERLIMDCGQTISVLRRLLQFEKNRQPQWAKGGNHIILIPALIAGSWDDQNENDKNIISLLAGQPYESYIASLSIWKENNDAPIFELRSLWRLTSVIDTWSILAAFLTKANIDQLSTVFLRVMQESNPELDYDENESDLVSQHAVKKLYSNALKAGLCQSLIMIGVFGDAFKLRATDHSQSFIDSIIHKLLFKAEGATWCSLSNVLPLLSEASPESFLTAIEDSLSNENPEILALFGKSPNSWGANHEYVWLLWALENLAYSPEYLLRVSMILAKLSRIAPTSNLSNKPGSSLKEIFVAWYRQTTADPKTKEQIIERLVKKEPDIAWGFLLSISPQDHSVTSPINTCRWRFDPYTIDRAVNVHEVWNFYSFVFVQLISLAVTEERLAELIDFYPNLPLDSRQTLLQRLKETRHSVDHSEMKVWNHIRTLLARHREHSQQNWTLPESELQKLDEIFRIYSPDNEGQRWLYVFEESWPEFPDNIVWTNSNEREDYTHKKRLQALNMLYSVTGLPGIVAIIDSLNNLSILAQYTAELDLNEQEEISILEMLNKDALNKKSNFAKHYNYAKAAKMKDEYVAKAWQSVQHITPDLTIHLEFLLSLPSNKAIWELADTKSDYIQKEYWLKVNIYLNHFELEERLYAIGMLQRVNRHITVIDEIAYKADDLSTEILYDILRKAATIPSAEDKRLDTYDVGKIFEVIYSRNDLDHLQLKEIEWHYLHYLAGRHSRCQPQALLKELTESSDFFVEVVSYVHMPDDGTKDDIPQEQLVARLKKADPARRLLDCWRQIPGVNKSGEIDKEVLHNWINDVREKAKKANRVYGVDSEIGNLMACYPRNDVFWPAHEICEIIDTLDSKVVLSHFETEIFNSRGTIVKSAYEGGNQERFLADYFHRMAKQIAPLWPFTASALTNLAKGYYRDAKSEDDRAHLDELR